MNYIKYILLSLVFLLPGSVFAVNQQTYVDISSTGIISATYNFDTPTSWFLGQYGTDTSMSCTDDSGSWPLSLPYGPLDTIISGPGGCVLADGQFILRTYYGGSDYRDAILTRSGGLWSSTDFSTVTRIISVFPSTTQATSTNFLLGLNYFATDDDANDNSIIIKQKIELNSAPILGNVWGGTGDIVASWSNAETFEYDVEQGLNTASTTYSSSQIGLRKVTTTIQKQGFSLFGFEFGTDILLSTTTYFLIGTTTSGDSIDSSIQDAVNDITNTASSTVDLISIKCNPFNLNFNIPQCVLYLIIPSSGTATALMTQAQQDIFNRFPFGYFTDALSILATTSTTTIHVINATVPSNLPGGGANIVLTLNDPLSSILNSTTSSFTNTSASSTDTFFEITYYYWKLIISLLFVLYVIGRFLPFIKHK